MSAKRFSDFVNANLVGKRIQRAYVHDNGCVRLVFSDGSAVEIGAAVAVGDIRLQATFPTITAAENEPTT